MRNVVRHGLSAQQRSQDNEDDDHLIVQASFDCEEPAPGDDLSVEKIEEMLKTYRESGRFEHSDEQNNLFKIKYWYAGTKFSASSL